MKIVIIYQRRSSSSEESLTLTPEEYYDPIEEGESYENDAVPALWYSYEYVGLVPDDLTSIRVEVCHDDGRLLEIESTRFFGSGKTWLMNARRFDEDGTCSSELLIVSSNLGGEDDHIIRIYKQKGDLDWSMTMNGVSSITEVGLDTFKDLMAGD